ncbi:hypothetical protein OK016_28295 [Vibrio chagasii]|nr:hypothetical protein [Vibrio chagasii]
MNRNVLLRFCRFDDGVDHQQILQTIVMLTLVSVLRHEWGAEMLKLTLKWVFTR